MQPKVKTSVGEETAAETVARITKAKESWGPVTNNTPTNTGPTTPTGGDDALMSMLMQAAEGISSRASNIETTINDAIGSLEQGGQAAQNRINTDYRYEKDFMLGQAQAGFDSFGESRGGFATQMAALRNLTGITDKSLRDLEARRQDALAANDAATASEIAKLQMEKVRFQMEAEQAYFSNLLSIGTYKQGQQSLDLTRENMQFEQAASLRDYDLKVKEEARAASYDTWKRSYDEQVFAEQKINNLFERQQSVIRTNIMSRELKLKELEAGNDLTPDPGFGSVKIQNETGVAANEALASIQNKIKSGEIQPDTPEHEAATVEAYLQLRRVLSTSQVSNDALAKTLGLSFDSEGELSMNLPEALPGEDKANFFDMIGNIFSEASAIRDNVLFNSNYGSNATTTNAYNAPDLWFNR